MRREYGASFGVGDGAAGGARSEAMGGREQAAVSRRRPMSAAPTRMMFFHEQPGVGRLAPFFAME